MFNRKRRIRIKKEPNVFIKTLKGNFLKILLFTIAFLMIISIAWEFLRNKEDTNVETINKKTLENYDKDLKNIYSNQNPNHNNVRIWVLNYTTDKYRKRNNLAAKVSECLIKGYELNGVTVEGNYKVLKQETLDETDKNCPYCVKELSTSEIRLYKGQTIVIYHNTKSDFDDNLADFLSFTGFDKKIVYRNNKKYLLDERDITIILGDDWDDSNLQYCGGIIN